jgi:hypothetical protein
MRLIAPVLRSTTYIAALNVMPTPKRTSPWVASLTQMLPPVLISQQEPVVKLVTYFALRLSQSKMSISSKSSNKYFATSFACATHVALALVVLVTLNNKGLVHSGLVQEDGGTAYGVDVSFPIHHASVSTNFPWLQNSSNQSSQPLQVLGDRQSFYDDFLRRCRQIDGRACDEAENFRIETNLKQPASMVVRTHN